MLNNDFHFRNIPNVHIEQYFLFLLISASVAFYLVYKSSSKYKIELFFLSYYLISGNLNEIITIAIPGFSLFEIQPIRLLFFLFTFFLIRKYLFTGEKFDISINGRVPWYELIMITYVSLVIISQFANMSDVGIGTVLLNVLRVLTILVLIVTIQLMADRAFYQILGKSIIIGAVFSSLISIVQLAADPYFLRIGDARLAFGNILRSNGTFTTEYFNSYYLITAIAWTLVLFKTKMLRASLIALFCMGVISSFQRMSWLILVLILAIYLVFVEKIAIEKLALAALSGLAIILTISLLYYQDIMNSTLVKDRLSDSVGGRQGYYSLVLDNIGQKPLFGYGDFNNDVYYYNMLRITTSRRRASGETGDLHSGYFSSLFLFGVPAFVCFTLFVIFSVTYFAKLYSRDLFFITPFLISIMYLIGNLTNTFLPLKYISVLYAIHLGIGMGMKKLNEKYHLEH